MLSGTRKLTKSVEHSMLSCYVPINVSPRNALNLIQEDQSFRRPLCNYLRNDLPISRRIHILSIDFISQLKYLLN
jgi:hypothetical protein